MSWDRGAYVVDKDMKPPTEGYFQESISDFLIDFAVTPARQ
jgi:hypothetical protein